MQASDNKYLLTHIHIYICIIYLSDYCKPWAQTPSQQTEIQSAHPVGRFEISNLMQISTDAWQHTTPHTFASFPWTITVFCVHSFKGSCADEDWLRTLVGLLVHLCVCVCALALLWNSFNMLNTYFWGFSFGVRCVKVYKS